MESQKLQIRHLMLAEFKKGNSAKATAEKIGQVYGSGLITDRAVRNWFVKFRSGDMSLKDEPRAGRPSGFDDNLLKAALEQNPHQSRKCIAERFNISQSTVIRHLEKLGKVTKIRNRKLLMTRCNEKIINVLPGTLLTPKNEESATMESTSVNVENKDIKCELLEENLNELEDVCDGIESFDQLKEYKKPVWLTSDIIEDLKVRKYCVSGQNHNHSDWPRTVYEHGSVPKTMVLHDFKNNYLQDRYVNGSSDPNCYRFHNWSSIDSFVYFSHKLVVIPPIGWINVAHRNGVQILGTIITEFTDGLATLQKILETSESRDMFISQIAQITIDFKLDGWFINVEHDVKEFLDGFLEFFTLLNDRIHQCNPKNLVIVYDSLLNDGTLTWCNEINENNRFWFDNCDGVLVNYDWSRENLQTTLNTVKGHKRDVYIGIDVFSRSKSYGGMQSSESAKIIREFGFSMGIFAVGWTYETLSNTPQSTFLERFEARDALFWNQLKPYLYENCITSEFVTFFGKGCTDNYFNVNCQQIQPVNSFCGDCNETCEELIPKKVKEGETQLKKLHCFTTENACKCLFMSNDRATMYGGSYILRQNCVDPKLSDILSLFPCYYKVWSPLIVLALVKIENDLSFDLVLRCQRINKSYFSIDLYGLSSPNVIKPKSTPRNDRNVGLQMINLENVLAKIDRKIDLSNVDLQKWIVCAYDISLSNESTFTILDIGVKNLHGSVCIGGFAMLNGICS